MKICVDVQSAIAQRAGIGRYTRILVEHLDRRAEAGELTLFYFDFQKRGFPIPVQAARSRAVRWCPGAIAQKAWKYLNFPPFEWFSGKADLYHFPNFTMPPLGQGKAIVTIHDMSFARFPQFAERKNLANLQARMPKTAQRADAIITISEFSADEIESLLHVPREKIHAIPLGIGPEFTPAREEDVAAMRETFALKQPYLLSVGTLEPRKNLALLVEAFEGLIDFDGELVLVGRRGWKWEPLFERIQASPCRERIRVLEQVDDSHLPAIYSGAEVFVISSHYEGFGFPPLEAMACGTPVISSTGGSLPETVGEAARIVEGFAAPDWTEAIAALLGDRSERERLSQAGRRRAKTFSWERTAELTWALYQKVLSS